MRKMVFPGDFLADSKMSVRGVYVEDGKSYASQVGLYDSDTGTFIPLEGPYEPQEGDLIIGVVSEVKPNGYRVQTGLPSETFISNKDIRESLSMGDIVVAKVRDVDEVGEITLIDATVLKGGSISQISPVKVPRVIGKKGSMLAQIKATTGSNIVIGKNGWIWIKGGDEYLATKAILKIESEAHTSGLTDKIADFLKKGGRE